MDKCKSAIYDDNPIGENGKYVEYEVGTKLILSDWVKKSLLNGTIESAYLNGLGGDVNSIFTVAFVVYNTSSIHKYISITGEKSDKALKNNILGLYWIAGWFTNINISKIVS